MGIGSDEVEFVLFIFIFKVYSENTLELELYKIC